MFKHQLVTSLDSGRFNSEGALQQSTTHVLGNSSKDNRNDIDHVGSRLAPQQEPAPVLT